MQSKKLYIYKYSLNFYLLKFSFKFSLFNFKVTLFIHKLKPMYSVLNTASMDGPRCSQRARHDAHQLINQSITIS